MPKLEHRKSRGGCARCKKRKVKCDELRPSCGACTKHAVPCDYPGLSIHPALPSPRRDQRSIKPPNTRRTSSNKATNTVEAPAPKPSGAFLPISVSSLLHPTPSPSSIGDACTTYPDACTKLPLYDGNGSDGTDTLPPQAILASQLSTIGDRNLLELRLMHYWSSSAYAFASFHKTDDYWRMQVPLLGFSHAFTLNAILALSAFRLARLEGSEDLSLLTHARKYFDEALIGQREALANMCEANAEAVFATSALVSVYALSVLRDTDILEGGDPSDSAANPNPFAAMCLWLRLGSGARAIWVQSRPWFARNERMRQLTMEPQLFLEDSVILRDENLHPFGSLLTWAADYEFWTPLDRTTYEKTVKYLGCVYRAHTQDKEEALASLRRISALPARVPQRLRELVEEQRPRALCVLAHVFGMVELINGDMLWNQGIAERQIPLLFERVPAAWRECMRWPMERIGRGDEVGPTEGGG